MFYISAGISHIWSDKDCRVLGSASALRWLWGVVLEEAHKANLARMDT